ncbi:MAG TPA: hypothetical protein VEY91_06865 [Candidatus Limnocylindria bacterium]|nr:hypothetical protein [Candidatus Limnocylindria bacterium]
MVLALAGVPRGAWCQVAAERDSAAAGREQVDEATPAAESLPSDDWRGQLESVVEQLQTLQSDTDKLKRFKFSGYLQVRWEHAEDQSDTVAVAGTTVTPANRERFFIRRGRFKLTYDSSPLSQAVVYFDGNTSSGTTRNITLLEAYVTLLDPWTVDHRHGLTIGQMNVPFGYEIERSSSVRELPERSRAENVLFAGERDRGIKLVSQWTPWLETVVAVLNGGGVNHPFFPNTDPTRMKDVLGRVRVSQGIVDGAVSYYDGRDVRPLVGPDLETDKTRLGADLQLYYELPALGGGSLKGEVYDGENLGADFTGVYAMWVQNLGERLQLAARWETFDPNTNLDHDQFDRVGLGINAFYDGFTRITVAYDIPNTDRSIGGGQFEDPDDNLWTVQFQHKF